MRGVDPYFGLGGAKVRRRRGKKGGGEKKEEKKKKKKINIKFRRKIKKCLFSSIFVKFNGFVVPCSAFKPVLALHIMNFSSCRNYWGGGKTYFHGG